MTEKIHMQDVIQQNRNFLKQTQELEKKKIKSLLKLTGTVNI
jgi:hypothetical protein